MKTVRIVPEVGECERCCEDGKMLVLSLEGNVCYNCAEELDAEDEEEDK